MTVDLWVLAQDATDTTGGAGWERVVIALVPVMLAVIALFNRGVRGKVTGTPKDPDAEPPSVSKTVAQTVSDGAGLQHMMVVDLQRRLDDEEAKTERLQGELTKAERRISALELELAEERANSRNAIQSLEVQIARMRAGWGQP